MTEDLETGVAEATSPEPTAIVTEAPSEPVQEAPEPDGGADEDADLKAIFRKNNPERSDDGKFASRNPVDPNSAVQTEDVGAEPAPPAIEAPQSWTAEMKAKWPSLAPDAQAYIAQREKEAAQALSRYGQQVKQFEPISATLEQFKGHFEKHGITPEVGVRKLLEISDSIDRDPLSAILWIANSKGIDLASSFNGQQGTAPPAVIHELTTLRQMVHDLSAKDASREERVIADQRTSIEKAIAEFSTKNQHFDALENDIAAYIPVIREANPGISVTEALQQAYDRAVWANPQTRAAKIEAETREKAEKAAAEAKKKAEAARRAAAVNVRSDAVGGTSFADLDNELRSVYRKNRG